MADAATDLLALGCDGLQLTPGCAPTPAFSAWLEYFGVSYRTHDGFSWRGIRQPVWSPAGECLVRSDSVHPPRSAGQEWLEHLTPRAVVEVMYPPHPLGTGDELVRAMDAGVALAVDVSHLRIQQHRGVLPDAVYRRVLAYDRVAEVHVSANDGRADRHWAVDVGELDVGWLRERSGDGVPVVCESYLHRLTEPERRAVIEPLYEVVGG